ncbi:MAG: MmgE/PrpD family protein, partial [Bacteroidales bacterium]|nr:MmgE/PrpD family protein [Bacteroidales bacterium]
KVSIVEDPEITSWLPEKRAARVTVVAMGRSYVHLVEYPKGEPENPMSETELKNRFF